MDTMQSRDGNWSSILDALVNGEVARIPADEVFVQTPSGAEVAASAHAEPPERWRILLILVNGRRRMSEFRDLLPRLGDLDDTFETLMRKGYIQRLENHRHR
jgi:hypothetical protein